MFKNKIKYSKKNALLAISLIAIFAVPMLAPLAFAQTGITFPRQTHGYITVAPNLIGVGQNATVTIFAQPFPTNYGNQPFYSNGYIAKYLIDFIFLGMLLLQIFQKPSHY